MLCKVTLGVLKGASKLNVLLFITIILRRRPQLSFTTCSKNSAWMTAGFSGTFD